MENISVLVVDKSIDHAGILTNAALVLGLTAGRLLPDETFGDDVRDRDGNFHTYLTRIGHVVRKAGASKLRRLRQALRFELPELLGENLVGDAWQQTDRHRAAQDADHR